MQQNVPLVANENDGPNDDVEPNNEVPAFNDEQHNGVFWDCCMCGDHSHCKKRDVPMYEFKHQSIVDIAAKYGNTYVLRVVDGR